MPAQPGDALADIDTPALVLDLDCFDGNLERMMSAAGAAGVRVRPHAKSHKSLQIAHRQIAAGAIGVCCQKIGEAEIFLGGGIRDVLITNEIVGVRKLRRLAQLAKLFSGARLGVCVDDTSVCASCRWCAPRRTPGSTSTSNWTSGRTAPAWPRRRRRSSWRAR